MHEKMHEKLKINEKERVKWTYRPWERKNLQKIWSKTTKNDDLACPSWREREKSLKTFEKSELNKSRYDLKKTYS